MKVLRIDLQGVCNNSVFKSKADLRKHLIEFHSIDYDQHFDENENYKPIEDFTLEEILEWGEWDYTVLTDEQAKFLIVFNYCKYKNNIGAYLQLSKKTICETHLKLTKKQRSKNGIY